MQHNGPCSNEYSVVSPGSSVKGRPRRSFPNTSPSFSVMSPSATLVREGFALTDDISYATRQFGAKPWQFLSIQTLPAKFDLIYAMRAAVP